MWSNMTFGSRINRDSHAAAHCKSYQPPCPLLKTSPSKHLSPLPPPPPPSYFVPPAPHIAVSSRLETQEWSDHCSQRPGQQFLTDPTGHQRERHGGHRRQDAGKGAADQLQTQVMSVGRLGLIRRHQCVCTDQLQSQFRWSVSDAVMTYPMSILVLWKNNIIDIFFKFIFIFTSSMYV